MHPIALTIKTIFRTLHQIQQYIAGFDCAAVRDVTHEKP